MLNEINQLNEAMRQDQLDIDNMKADTDTLKAETLLLKSETRSILKRLGASL